MYSVGNACFAACPDRDKESHERDVNVFNVQIQCSILDAICTGVIKISFGVEGSVYGLHLFESLVNHAKHFRSVAALPGRKLGHRRSESEIADAALSSAEKLPHLRVEAI